MKKYNKVEIKSLPLGTSAMICASGDTVAMGNPTTAEGRPTTAQARGNGGNGTIFSFD